MHTYANYLRTTLLLGLVAAAVVALGACIGRVGLLVAVVGATGLCTYLAMVGPSLPLRAMRARRVSEIQQPLLYALVRELSTSARQPMPALYVSPTGAPNAFATGPTPSRAAVCCTAGLLDQLDEQELRAVLAHELAHVYARDTLTASVAGALGAVIVGLAGFGYVLGFGDGGSRRSRLVEALLSVLAPVAGGLIRLGVSRTAVFRADQGGALLSGNPTALIRALSKTAGGVAAAPLAPEPDIAVHAHAMTVSPFRDGDRFSRAFRSHPPVAERIRRLRQLTD